MHTLETEDRPDPDAAKSELDEPRWAVISFERCEKAGLSYDEASKELGRLEGLGLAGLCLVTDKAAERLAA